MSGSLHPIVQAISTCHAFEQLCDQLPGRGQHRLLGGAIGSASTAVVAALHERFATRVLVVVAPSPQAATDAEADLEVLLGREESFLFPQREALPYESNEPHLEIGGLRVEAVEALLGGRARLMVTTLRALQERAPIPAGLAELRITLRTGQEPGFQRLVQDLDERGFERVPLVEEVGQYAVRGGLLDIFSFGTLEPFRVEFWGDEVVSLRFFDILDQRSKESTDEVHILPVDFHRQRGDESVVSRSLLELLPADALLLRFGDEDWSAELARTWRHVCRLHDELQAEGNDPEGPETLFVSSSEAEDRLSSLARVDVSPDASDFLELACVAPPVVDRDMSRLGAALRAASGMGHKSLVLCDNRGQCDRLEEILGGPEKIPPGANVVVGSLAAGFVLECADPPLQVSDGS